MNSPNLTGTPTTTTPPDGDDSQKICNTAWVNSVITAGKLGYTPVRQGGVSNQGTNTVYIGWATDGSGLLATVDSSDLGPFAFESWVEGNYLNLTGGNITGTLTLQGTSVATVNTVNDAETDVKNWTGENYLSLSGGTLNGSLTVNSIIYGNSDVHVGSGKWLYTDNIKEETTGNNINVLSNMYAESGVNLFFNGASSITVPTVSASDNSTNAASTSFVNNQNYIKQQIDNNTYGITHIGFDHVTAEVSAQDSEGTWHLLADKNWTGENYLSLSGGTLNGSLTVNSIIYGNSDVHVGSGKWLYTDNIISETSGDNINFHSNMYAESGVNLFFDSANSVTVPTVSTSDNSTNAASTAYVKNSINSYSYSGTFSGGGYTILGNLLTQYFTVSNISAADTQNITFPKDFSGTPYSCVVTWSDTNNASSYANVEQGGLSSSGVIIRARANTSGNTWVNSGGTAYIIVSGPA
ncbi:hypothetical protein D3W54_15895 (plasmid) [Komagataeibacter medellinensis]|uniref:Outer membrane protein n=1 Tax=Komagataeibacter medellinensis TaxID=1177712 RepID=A0ABQ6VSA2_9PROT|nr:hypothetical protein D3W54_15895 [Komagataeibacter medellinensis]